MRTYVFVRVRIYTHKDTQVYIYIYMYGKYVVFLFFMHAFIEGFFHLQHTHITHTPSEDWFTLPLYVYKYIRIYIYGLEDYSPRGVSVVCVCWRGMNTVCIGTWAT